jgi:hypothetical protein
VSSELPRISGKRMVKFLEKKGLIVVRVRGSHRKALFLQSAPRGGSVSKADEGEFAFCHAEFISASRILSSLSVIK